MFGIGALLGGGGGLPSVSSSASTGDQTQGDTNFGSVGGFGSFAVGSGAKAEGGGGGGGTGDSNKVLLYVVGGIAALAVLFMGASFIRKG